MREGSVFEPLNERRKCNDYDKKLQENRIRRTMTTCGVLGEKMGKLKEIISVLEGQVLSLSRALTMTLETIKLVEKRVTKLENKLFIKEQNND